MTLLQTPSKSWLIWSACVTGIILMIIGSFRDLRVLVLGLMICVAIVPAIVALIYFSYSLSPEIVPNLVPHTIETLPDGYILRFWKQSDPQDDDINQENSTVWTESSSIRLYASEVTATKSSPDYKLLLFPASSPLQILYLPHS